jgi:hypothetical protein
MPTISSNSAARSRAALVQVHVQLERFGHLSPIVSTGLSDVIGSWKTMAISLPRTLRISSSSSLRMSLPLEEDLARDNLTWRLGE